GLPGLDAYNEVVIHRAGFRGVPDKMTLKWPPATCPGQVVRIPLRTRPGEPLPFGPEDVVLHTGDVVYLERRNHGVFFTGGLLPSGEHELPRDRDLDVVEAVTRVRGPLVNGGISTNNLAGNLIAPGIGGPSPSLLVVMRRLPGGGRVNIRVDL